MGQCFGVCMGGDSHPFKSRDLNARVTTTYVENNCFAVKSMLYTKLKRRLIYLIYIYNYPILKLSDNNNDIYFKLEKKF